MQILEIASHELRTPVAAMTSASSGLAELGNEDNPALLITEPGVAIVCCRGTHKTDQSGLPGVFHSRHRRAVVFVGKT